MIGIIDSGKKKVVLWTHAGREHLGNVHPSFFICCRENVESSQRRSQHHRHTAIKQNSPGTTGNCHHDHEQRHGIVHHHRGWRIGQPRGGNDQREWNDCSSAALLQLKDIQKKQRQQRSGEQLGKSAAPINDDDVVGIGSVESGGKNSIPSI